jgi:hypothetical protein
LLNVPGNERLLGAITNRSLLNVFSNERRLLKAGIHPNAAAVHVA